MGERTIEVLTLCTGNACRSPMAAALLARHLAARRVDAVVRSAGTRAWAQGATALTQDAMREYGVDLAAHRNAQLDAAVLARADLVLVMTRDHVAMAVARCPAVEPRAFLVGELARLGTRVGPPARDEPVRDWAGRVAAARPPGRPIGRAGEEVADPVGEPLAVHRRTAATLDRHLATIAELLATPAELGHSRTHTVAE